MLCYRMRDYKITMVQTSTAEIYIYDGAKAPVWFNGPRSRDDRHKPIPTLNLTLRGIYNEIEELFKNNKET